MVKLLVTAVALVALAGCGDDDESPDVEVRPTEISVTSSEPCTGGGPSSTVVVTYTPAVAEGLELECTPEAGQQLQVSIDDAVPTAEAQAMCDGLGGRLVAMICVEVPLSAVAGG